MSTPPPGWQPPPPPQPQRPLPPQQPPQPYGPPPGMPPQGMPPQGGPPPGGPTPPFVAQPVSPEQRRRRDDNTASVFAYVGLFASFIVPLILYLIKKNDSPYVRHHAAQAMNLAFTGLAYTLIAGVFGTLAGLSDKVRQLDVFGLPVVFLVLFYLLFAVNAVSYVVFLVVGAVKASGGQYYRMPGWRCWRMVR